MHTETRSFFQRTRAIRLAPVAIGIGCARLVTADGGGGGVRVWSCGEPARPS